MCRFTLTPTDIVQRPQVFVQNRLTEHSITHIFYEVNECSIKKNVSRHSWNVANWYEGSFCVSLFSINNHIFFNWIGIIYCVCSYFDYNVLKGCTFVSLLQPTLLHIHRMIGIMSIWKNCVIYPHISVWLCNISRGVPWIQPGEGGDGWYFVYLPAKYQLTGGEVVGMRGR